MFKLRVFAFRLKVLRLAKDLPKCVVFVSDSADKCIPKVSEAVSQLLQIRPLIKVDLGTKSSLPSSQNLNIKRFGHDYNYAVNDICKYIKPDYVVIFKSNDNVEILKHFEAQNIPVICIVMNAIPVSDSGNAVFYTSSRIIFLNSEAHDAAIAARPWLIVRSTTTLPDRLAELGQALETKGQEAMALKAHTVDDEATIRESGLFDREFYLASQHSDPWRDAIKEFVKTYQTAYPYYGEAGQLLRRPCKGFDPVGYMTDCRDWPAGATENPFAHFIRQGMPAGAWNWRTVALEHQTGSPAQKSAVLHAHFYYADLIEDFIGRLQVNGVEPHLIVTTDSESKRAALHARLSEVASNTFEVRVHENRGRDIGPFLSLLRSGAFDEYSIVGHVHGKQSPHLKEIGAAWRSHAWEHLLGGKIRSMDIIAKLFTDDDKLGLVFAEERCQYGWGANKDIAQELVGAMGLNQSLPQRFQFPAGSMFWVRPEAIRQLCVLGKEPFDFPEEPLALDGTILHATERILPFVVGGSGYSWATVSLDTFY